MTSKEALRKIKFDDFTPINDLVYRKCLNDEIIIVKPMYLGASPEDCYNIIEKDLDKLSQLNNIEEIIEKMYKQPIYEKCNNTIYEEDYTDSSILYNFKNNAIEIYEDEFVERLKVDDYSKTWSFTKEELENA